MIRVIAPPARVLARLLALPIFVVLALLGAAVAISSIRGGSGAFTFAGLAELLSLSSLRDSIESLLGAVEASGPVAIYSALAGLGAALLGAILLLGALVRPNERLFEADVSDEGRISAKPRPRLAAAATELTRRTDGVTGARTTARASRSGGRLQVVATHRGQDRGELESRIAAATSRLRSSFGLKTRIRTEEGGKGSRVE